MGSFQKQPGDHAEELGVVDAAVAVHVGLLKGHSKVVTFSAIFYSQPLPPPCLTY